MGNHCGCGAPSGCCANHGERRVLTVEFLYLDLDVCERCIGTDGGIEEAIERTKPILAGSNIDIRLEKIKVDSEESAAAHRFYSSPTIRIDGRDLQEEIHESCCQDCGDLCGDSVDCRVWSWQGQSYEQPPADMIVDAILKAAYGGTPHDASPAALAYALPENLRKFFRGAGGQ